MLLLKKFPGKIYARDLSERNLKGDDIYSMVNYDAGQEQQTQVQLPEAGKFCSWVSENGSLVVHSVREISFSGLVSDNFQSKKISKLKFARGAKQ